MARSDGTSLCLFVSDYMMFEISNTERTIKLREDATEPKSSTVLVKNEGSIE
jgi:hypothetical protein